MTSFNDSLTSGTETGRQLNRVSRFGEGERGAMKSGPGDAARIPPELLRDPAASFPPPCEGGVRGGGPGVTTDRISGHSHQRLCDLPDEDPRTPSGPAGIAWDGEPVTPLVTPVPTDVDPKLRTPPGEYPEL